MTDYWHASERTRFYTNTMEPDFGPERPEFEAVPFNLSADELRAMVREVLG